MRLAGQTRAAMSVCLTIARRRRRAVGRASQMVVLAVKPQMMDEAIADMGGIADADTAFFVNRSRYSDILVQRASC